MSKEIKNILILSIEIELVVQVLSYYWNNEVAYHYND